MPKPGVNYPIGNNFLSFFQDRHGTTPFISLPHKGTCLEWLHKGGDDKGFDHGHDLTEFFSRHGVPSAALGISDGQPPVWLYNGLIGTKDEWLYEEIQAMIEDSRFSWGYDHDVVAESASFGDFFERLPFRNVLRFADCSVSEEEMDTICTVIGHYGRGPMKVHYSPELQDARVKDISRMLISRKAPVILPASI